MQNFEFYNPTHIIFGKETIAKLDRMVPEDAHVLVLYGGGSVKSTGTLQEVENALGKRKVSLFSGIEANPTYETLMKAVKQIEEEKIDFLLAVGGGSVLDGTKFVAAAVCFKGEDPWRILQTHGAVVESAMPFGTVLTLPATGSEMNSGAVITNKANQAKLAFSSRFTFPVFSIMDPTKTYSLPLTQIANGVVDSFIHVMEQYLTYPVNGMVQDKYSEGLLRSLVEIGPKLLIDGEDYDLRANFMWIATQALNGLISAGVPQDWTTHMIGHEITALYNIDHARTLAMVLPSVMEIEKESKKAKLLQYAEEVWHITEGSKEEKINEAIEKTRAFFESLDIKTSLADFDLGEDDVEKIVSQLEAHGMVRLGENKSITPEISRKILMHSLYSKK